jgi:hypothetical protein
MEAEGVMLMLPVAVGVAVMDMDSDMDISDDMEEAADATAEEASERTEDASEAMEEAMEEAAEAAADVAEATAELAAGALASGMLMGAPAAEQVDSTAAMAAAWSEGPQAPWTQGWTWERSWAPFLQWQAKSVREEQPSLVRGPTKQLSCALLVYMTPMKSFWQHTAQDGMLSSWAAPTEARATMVAMVKVFILTEVLVLIQWSV